MKPGKLQLQILEGNRIGKCGPDDMDVGELAVFLFISGNPHQVQRIGDKKRVVLYGAGLQGVFVRVFQSKETVVFFRGVR